MPSHDPQIDVSSLFEFLDVVAGELPRKIILVGIGGTAMTLLKVKASTRDIDFTGPGDDIVLFRRIMDAIPHGMKVDTWADGQIFSQFLPPDYLAKSKRVRKLGNIDLRALHPLDIVVTKIGRLDERDIQDIQDCIRTFGLLKSDVKKRASQMEYLGNVEDFKYHVRLALNRFFK